MTVTEMQEWFTEMERAGYGDVEVFMEHFQPVRRISIGAMDAGRKRFVELHADTR